MKSTHLILAFFVAACLASVAFAHVELAKPRVQQDVAFQPEGIVCDLCVFVVGWVEKELRNGTTEHRIAEEIGFFCQIFPWILGDAIVAIIINLLEALLPPNRICYIINMCASLAQLFPKIHFTELRCAKAVVYAGVALKATEKVSDASMIPAVAAQSCTNTFTDAVAIRECLETVANPLVIEGLKARMTPDLIAAHAGTCRPV